MKKTITVKGSGTLSVKPDLIVLSMSMNTCDKDYDRAMTLAADNIAHLNQSLEAVGFEHDAVKTTAFRVDTDYESKKDRDGNYYREFVGYEVNHRLKLSFDLDLGRLAQALAAIAGCVARPELSVSFTIKDPAAANEALLVSAAANARSQSSETRIRFCDTDFLLSHR